MSDPRVPEDRAAKAAEQFLRAGEPQTEDPAATIAYLRGRLAYAEQLSFANGFEVARLMPFEKKAAGWEKHANMLQADLKEMEAAMVELEPLSARSQAVADTRARLAYLIRAELVCCHIYEKVAGPLDEVYPHDRTIEHKEVADWDERQKAAKADGTWHAICYYGEWAAQLCEKGELPQGELFYGPWNPAWGEPCEANRPKVEVPGDSAA